MPQTFATINFSSSVVQANGATFMSGMGMGYNTRYGNSWLLNTGMQNNNFSVAFDLGGLPVGITLALTHCTSSDGSSAGYSPIDISLNGNSIVQNFDPAKAHGGSTDFVLDQFPLPKGTLIMGSNELLFTAGRRGQTNYWIRLLELQQ